MKASLEEMPGGQGAGQGNVKAYFKSVIKSLKDDEEQTNFELLNRYYVLTKSLDLKQCSSCGMFSPNQLIESSKSESLIYDGTKEKKDSDLYIFIKLILVIKNDQPTYLSRLWSDHHSLSVEKLREKEQETNNLEAKRCLREMQDIVTREATEKKVNIEDFKKALGGGSDNNSFLEKFHIKLKNEVQYQVFERTRYAAMMIKLHYYIEHYVIVEIRKAIQGIHKSMSSSEKIVHGKKKREAFECLTYNFRLGFSNWPESEAFEKENRFVKKLRQSIYKEGVSQLIFQDLTKNEKAYISTKMFLDHKYIKDLIDMKRFSEQM